MLRRQKTPSPLIVLGAGPVGLMAALRARQMGLSVKVITDRIPTLEDPFRLEAVPAQLIALFVEFGVHPKLIGVERTHQHRFTQWQTAEVVAAAAPASAHVTRPALDVALLHLADRADVAINVVGSSARFAADEASTDGPVILDSTGRSAVTARHISRPDVPLVCRTFTQTARSGVELDGFSVAAGPQGYAYRLGNAQRIALGVVGHGALLRGSADVVVANIQTFAPWIVEGIDCSELVSGCAGAASLQWCSSTTQGVQLIGDARLARDALASQGIALGISDALKAVSAIAETGSVELASLVSQLTLHRHRVIDLIAESPFAFALPWQRYVDFLRAETQLVDPATIATRPR